jgi:hypothetical protein
LKSPGEGAARSVAPGQAWRPLTGAEECGKGSGSEPTALVVFEIEEVPDGAMLTVVESGFGALPPARRHPTFVDRPLLAGCTAATNRIPG